jgi:hypothetical protein
MTASVKAWDLLKPKQTSMMPESPPTLLFGQGTPNGDLEPFKSAQKGTLYFQSNETDDKSHVYMKVDEAGDDDDWEKLTINNTARQFATTREIFNIDNGGGTTADQIILVPVVPITIVAARVVYTEATGASGAASATVQLGTTIGGVDIVAATALEVSKDIGAVTELTIANGAVAADELVAVRHTGVAATVAGEYFVQIEYKVND